MIEWVWFERNFLLYAPAARPLPLSLNGLSAWSYVTNCQQRSNHVWSFPPHNSCFHEKSWQTWGQDDCTLLCANINKFYHRKSMRVVDEKLIINKLGPSYKVCIVGWNAVLYSYYLPWLYLALLPSTKGIPGSITFYHHSNLLYFTLLLSTIALPPSTRFYHGSTLLFFTLLLSTMALIYCYRLSEMRTLVCIVYQ